MALTGAWKITTPVGAFGDSGTIKLTLTKTEGCDTEQKKAAPAAKTPPAQKKRKG
jgi:hypothetical protein